MTRRSVLRIVRAAKQHRWTVVLGGPESANYLAEYLGAGADVIVIGEGELTLSGAAAALAARGPHRLHGVRGIAFRDETGRHRAHRRRAPRSRTSTRCPGRTAKPSITSCTSTPGRPITARAASTSSPRAAARTAATGARTPSMAFTHRRRSPANVADEVQWIVDRYAPGPGLVRRRRVHDQPSLAGQLHRRAQAPRHSSAVRNHHARRPAAERRRRRRCCASSAAIASGSARRAAARGSSTPCSAA